MITFDTFSGFQAAKIEFVEYYDRPKQIVHFKPDYPAIEHLVMHELHQILAYYYVSWKLAKPDLLSKLQLPFEKEYQIARTMHRPGPR